MNKKKGQNSVPGIIINEKIKSLNVENVLHSGLKYVVLKIKTLFLFIIFLNRIPE